MAPRSPSIELPLEIEEFLSWLVAEKGRSENTLSAYRRDLTAYFVWLTAHGRTIEDVPASALVAFVGERRASGAATSSIARQLAAIRMLHRYLALEGVRGDDPAAELEGVRVPSGIPKPLTEAQVTSLLDAVIVTEPVHRRDLALLELLYGTGARISEAVGLSVGAIDLDARLVRLFGKGAKERIVPFGIVGGRGARGLVLSPRVGRSWCPHSGAGATTPKRCSSTPAVVASVGRRPG